MKTSDMLMLAIVAFGGLWVFRKFKLAMPTLTSTAEKRVDALYGPSQSWRTNPVYNTPGTPGYIPGLPASYPPRAPGSGYLVPPSTYSGAPLTPAQMTSFELYNLTYGGGLTGLESNGRWLS